MVVLPTPRTPVRIQACGMRPVSNAFEIVRTMASWPIRSSKVSRPVFARQDAVGRSATGRPPADGIGRLARSLFGRLASLIAVVRRR